MARNRNSFRPNVDQFETRDCPAPVRIAIVVPQGFGDEIALGKQIISRIAPTAKVSVVTVRHEFEALGMAAGAGRQAEVVVMPWTINSGATKVRDLGLFRTDYVTGLGDGPVTRWPWKVKHPDTVYVAAAGDREQSRAPANFAAVLSAGATSGPSAQSSVVANTTTTSEAAFVWAGLAARLVSIHGERLDTDGFARLLRRTYPQVLRGQAPNARDLVDRAHFLHHQRVLHEYQQQLYEESKVLLK